MPLIIKRYEYRTIRMASACVVVVDSKLNEYN